MQADFCAGPGGAVRPVSPQRVFSVLTGHGAETALRPVDECLLRLFLTACNHRWKELPALGQKAIDTGCSQLQLRATIRHMPM